MGGGVSKLTLAEAVSAFGADAKAKLSNSAATGIASIWFGISRGDAETRRRRGRSCWAALFLYVIRRQSDPCRAKGAK